MQKLPLILMYHRIADVETDPWSLAVSPAHFAEQLSVLRRSRTPLSLDEFVTRHNERNLPTDAVAVTLDDGYVDNLKAAKPRLEAEGIPATVYIATGFLNQDRAFWWSELAELVLLRIDRESVGLFIDGRIVRFELGPSRPSAIAYRTRASPEPQIDRRSALQKFRTLFRSLDDQQRALLIDQLRKMSPTGISSPGSARPMTNAEVRELAGDGLVSVGAHTVTHPWLTSLEPQHRQAEILQSKWTCEEVLGHPVTGFAYPFGDGNEDVRSIVAAAKFSHACSIEPGPVLPTSDVFVLPRVKILDGDGNAFERALRSAESTPPLGV